MNASGQKRTSAGSFRTVGLVLQADISRQSGQGLICARQRCKHAHRIRCLEAVG